MSHLKSLLRTWSIFLVMILTGIFSFPAYGQCTQLVENIDTGGCFSTLQAAIDDTGTLNGHTLKIAAGSLNEHVIVSKSLTIEGVSKFSTYLNGIGTCSTDIMRITAGSVTVRNLCVHGCGASGPGYYSGIRIQGTNYCLIEDVMVVDCTRSIFLANSSSTKVRNCMIYTTGNTIEGIHIGSGSGNRIYKNSIFRIAPNVKMGFGILLSNTSGNYVYSNEISNHSYGVWGWTCSGNEISSNKIISNEKGIYFDTGTANNIIANTIQYCDEGIYLYLNSSNNYIHRNNFSDNSIHNAYLDQSSYACTGNNWSHSATNIGNYWGPGGSAIIPASSGNPDTDSYPLSSPYVVVCGDVDGNGVVDAYDEDYLICYLFFTCPNPLPPILWCAGDLNGDSVIDISDLTILINYFTGNSVCLNCKCN